MTKQNNALRLAELLELAPEDGIEPQTSEDAAAELRRQHTRIAELQARIKTMAEEHADELMVAHLDGRMRAAQPVTAQQPGAALSALFREAIAWGMAYGPVIPAHQWDEMRESMVKHYADRAVRVAQPAGAQQPASHGGVSVEPTPEQIMAAAKVMQSHDVPDDEPKWDELPDWQIKVWLEGAEKALKAAWAVTAPTSQPAPAQAAPAAVAGPWSAGELDGNWLHIDHKDHAGVIRIVWKMEGDARNPVCEARAMAVIAALNAYAAPTTQPAPQQEAASVDLKTMELAESVGLIGPASRTNDLHAAIQRFHDLICANATIKAAAMAVEVISGVSAHQWDTGYPPLPKPNIQRGGFPNLFTEDQMRAYVDADRAARAPADSVTAPVGERENLALRRMLCVAHAGAAAYMDDGEAQDSRELPLIDFLRDTPAEIQDKLQKRMLNKPAAGAPTPPAQAADSVLEDAARLDWLDEDAGNHVTRVGKTWYTRPTYGHPYRKHKNLRAAIDAARAAQEGKSHGN